jgi:WD40 repeat protein
MFPTSTIKIWSEVKGVALLPLALCLRSLPALPPGLNLHNFLLPAAHKPFCPSLQGDSWMLAASGDQTISLWDTGLAEPLGFFKGHTGSVKSVCPQPGCSDVFASGGPAAPAAAT